MADKSLAERVEIMALGRIANDRAAETIRNTTPIGENEIRSTFSTNVVNPEYSLIDFNLFITGTIFRVTYEKDGNESYFWFVTEREKNHTYAFLIKEKGEVYNRPDLPAKKYNLSPKGSYDIIKVGDTTNVFVSKKGYFREKRDYKTVKIDVMQGGLAGRPGKEVPVLGEETRIFAQEKKTNEN